MIFPIPAPDKLAHFYIGAVLASIISVFSPMVALVFVVLLAASKELSDYIINRRKILQGVPPIHCVEFLDFVFTTLGAISVLAPTYIRSLL